MTKRDTFLSKAEYMQLVYAACSPTRPGLTDAADHVLLPPTILKPESLYTGKQVIHISIIVAAVWVRPRALVSGHSSTWLLLCLKSIVHLYCCCCVGASHSPGQWSFLDLAAVVFEISRSFILLLLCGCVS